MKSFLARFGSLISFILTGFDRLRFRGESRRLNNAKGVDSYLYQHDLKSVDFVKHAESLTACLTQQTEEHAKNEGVPLVHLNSSRLDKQAIALEQAENHQRRVGRIAVLSVVESCSIYKTRKQQSGILKPVKQPGRCKHYYHYFLHEQLGLCYVRIQSWFPFQIRVGLNGREWLYRQLEQRGVGFQKRNNLLLSVDDVALAQQLLDEQRRTDWPTLLSDLVRPVQPLWSYLHDQVGVPYYWMTEQSEWASDFVFHSPKELAYWYERWLRHGSLTLQCHDIMRYLGKKNPARCPHEAKIDLRQRVHGTRLKFWYGANSLKIYDKESKAFRIEMTINQPRDFKVYRTKEGEPQDAPKSWQNMRKGVADLDRRAEVSDAANNRLAESLATVAEPTTLGKLLKPLGKPVIVKGQRKARALNPLTGADGELLRALAQGDYLLTGFRNRDLRRTLHGESRNADERRKQSAAVTRKLALLRAHGLILKVAKTHRYKLSKNGKRVMTALLAAHASDVSQLASSA